MQSTILKKIRSEIDSEPLVVDTMARVMRLERALESLVGKTLDEVLTPPAPVAPAAAAPAPAPAPAAPAPVVAPAPAPAAPAPVAVAAAQASAPALSIVQPS